MSKSIISILNSPYPREDRDRSYYTKLGLVGLFVALFLFVFRPFNLEGMESDLLRQCIIFGLITFVVSAAYDLLINDALKLMPKDETHVLWKWIVNNLGLLICIGVVNFLYLHFVFDMPIRFLGRLISATFLVGVFPLFFIGMMVVIKGEQKYSTVAEEMMQDSSRIKEQENVDLFGIASKTILYIEGLQNYVQVYHLDDDNMLQSRTERSTMKSLEDPLINTGIKRCHRSFYVNESKILEVTGNAQGLRLKLENCVKEIPVSRRYIPVFRHK